MFFILTDIQTDKFYKINAHWSEQSSQKRTGLYRDKYLRNSCFYIYAFSSLTDRRKDLS